MDAVTSAAAPVSVTAAARTAAAPAAAPAVWTPRANPSGSQEKVIKKKLEYL